MASSYTTRANKWTTVAQGSFNGISRKYKIRSLSGRDFKWRWQGSFLPFQRSGNSKNGEVVVNCGFSLYWRVQVRTPTDDTIWIGLPEE